METIGNALGAPIDVTISDKHYKVTALTLDDLAAFEQSIKARRLDLLISATQNEDVKYRAMATSEVLARDVSANELFAEMGTLHGTRFMLWRALNKHQPMLTLEAVSGMINQNNMGEITEVINKLGGESPNLEGAADQENQ